MYPYKRFCLFLCVLVLTGLSFLPPAFSADYREGEVLVLLRNATGKTLSKGALSHGDANDFVAKTARGIGAKAVRTYDALSMQTGDIFTLVKSEGRTTRQLIEDLSRDPNVVAVCPNYRMERYTSEPNDTYYKSGLLWGMKKIRADEAWDITRGSPAVNVAVIDSGIAATHADLKDNLNLNLSRNFTTDPDYTVDLEDHGPHVSGTIGAVGNNGLGVAGVNWNTKIITLKVFTEEGYNTMDWLIAAVDKVTEYVQADAPTKIPAVNLSLGAWLSYAPDDITTPPAPGDSKESLYLYWKAFKALSDTDRTLLVVAAGNDNREVGAPTPDNVLRNGKLVGYKGDYVYPASFTGIDNMIVVAAVDTADKAATFTNWSDTVVDIAAPGVGIWSTVPGPDPYKPLDGTSMAAPHVSGAAGLLASLNPDTPANKLKELLLDNANTNVNPVLVNQYNPSNQKISSCGLLDIKRAVDDMRAKGYAVLATSITIGNPSGRTKLYTNGTAAERSLQLSAAVQPTDVTKPGVTWASDNPNAVSVDQTGLVTATANGKGRITATAVGSPAATPVLGSVEIEAATYVSQLEMAAKNIWNGQTGDPFWPVVNVLPANASDYRIEWRSDDPGVASIVPGGDEREVDGEANAPGTTRITAKVTQGGRTNDIQAVMVVNVLDPATVVPVSSLEAIPAGPVTLAEGETLRLSVKLTPSDATDKTLRWSSDRSTVASIERESGLLTASSPGTANITATTDTHSVSSNVVQVTVTPRPSPVVDVQDFNLNAGDTFSMRAGETRQLSISIRPPNATDQTIWWQSEDTVIATVDDFGLVRAWREGTTRIEGDVPYSFLGSKTSVLTVLPGEPFVSVAGLAFANRTMNLAVGQVERLDPVLTPPNASNKQIRYQTDQPHIAAVTADGYVTALSPGKATVVASAAGGTGAMDCIAVSVTGDDDFVPTTKLDVSPSSLKLQPNASQKLEATVGTDPAYGKAPSVTTVSWSSSNEGVARVDADGVVRAMAIGKATVTARALGGLFLSATIPVEIASDSPPGPSPGPDPSPSPGPGGSTIWNIDGRIVSSIAQSGNTLTVVGTSGTIWTYDLANEQVNFDYPASSFSASERGGDVIFTALGEIVVNGTFLTVTATRTGDIGKSTGEAYTFPIRSVNTGGRTNLSVPLDELPYAIYNFTFRNPTGSNPYFAGVLAENYEHRAETSGAVLSLRVERTSEGRGLSTSATALFDNIGQTDVEILFELIGDLGDVLVRETRISGTGGSTPAFILADGLAEGAYTVRASADDYPAKSLSISIDPPGALSSSNGGCGAGIGLGGLAVISLCGISLRRK